MYCINIYCKSNSIVIGQCHSTKYTFYRAELLILNIKSIRSKFKNLKKKIKRIVFVPGYKHINFLQFFV